MTTASPQPQTTPSFPAPPASLFLVGIGGIGMSGLAQLLRHQGYHVAGSDRDLTSPGREELLRKLSQAGIGLHPQDGTGLRERRPAAVVYSSAVEPGNADLQAAQGLPAFTRAATLAEALNRAGAPQIAVAGSCGKTTVTGWLSSTLRALGQRVLMVCGGIVNEFETAEAIGNFAADSTPQWLVYEVDESDGSLVAFEPDYGVLLNIGTDHFERGQLTELFGRFLARCRDAVVLPGQMRGEFRLPSETRRSFFGQCGAPGSGTDGLQALNYTCSPTGITFDVPPLGRFCARQFGRHSATNATSVLALLQLLPIGGAVDWARALSEFGGIRQRFERLGLTRTAAAVYSDYAHNVEKIHAALQTAQEMTAGRVVAVFQPHGYGPLGFMREPLREMLAAVLRPGDVFIFLPVYYAGGTTSFTPQAQDVADEYRVQSLPVLYAEDRTGAGELIRQSARADDTVIVMGARDPSLPVWARQLAARG